MKSCFRFLTCLAALTVCAAASFAQGLGNNTHLTLTQNAAWLLAEPGVQIDLKLNTDQKSKVEAAFDAYNKKIVNAPNDAAVDKLDLGLATDLSTVLESAQGDRLFQIAVQLKGVPALTDKAVIAKLALTADELKKIKAELDEADNRDSNFEDTVATRLEAIPEPAPNADRKAYEFKRKNLLAAVEPERATNLKLRQENEAKALAVLTDAQKQVWEQLKGAKYLAK